MSEPRILPKPIAEFELRGGPRDPDGYAADRLKRNLLDAIGFALGALRRLVQEFGDPGRATMIGGDTTAADKGMPRERLPRSLRRLHEQHRQQGRRHDRLVGSASQLR